jgi:hypothetical protein
MMQDCWQEDAGHRNRNHGGVKILCTNSEGTRNKTYSLLPRAWRIAAPR